jgi:hypothetical protein
MRRRRPLLFLGGRGPAPALPASELAPLPAERLALLEWRQEGRWYRPSWTLWCDGACVATLVPEGFSGRHGRFETRDGRWHVRRLGLFGGFAVLKSGVEEPLARYRPSWFRGGRVERAAAAMLLWKPGFFGRGGALTNEEEFPLLTTRSIAGFFRFEGRVTVEQSARALPDLLPLVALTWWLILERPRHHGAH